MTLDLFRLVFDFGMLVLIWIVQLVIYPSFQFYSKSELKTWHTKYMFRFSLIVAPLMIIQTLIIGLQIYDDANLYTILSGITILILWITTQFQFVPIHLKISYQQFEDTDLVRLVKLNWIRTILWTGLIWLTVWDSFL